MRDKNSGKKQNYAVYIKLRGQTNPDLSVHFKNEFVGVPSANISLWGIDRQVEWGKFE